MPEYRPCIVTETIYPPHGMQGIIEHRKHNALFHQWIKKTVPHYDNADRPKTGGWLFMSRTGNDEFLMAIVEYEDGTIHECLPHEIQFTDGKSKKIFKTKKEYNVLSNKKICHALSYMPKRN